MRARRGRLGRESGASSPHWRHSARCWRWQHAAAAGRSAAPTRGRRPRRRAARRPGLDVLQLARLHRPGIRWHHRSLRQVQRPPDQVHRGRQRQQPVLREDAAAAPAGAVRGPQPLRRHRLDGEADARPRLPAEHQPGDHPDRRQEPDPQTPQLAPRPESAVLDPLAERHDWDLGGHLEGAGDPLGQRSLQAQVQGQGRHSSPSCGTRWSW